MQDVLKPPVYCPDALATDVGWINPKNGELLIAVKNLRQRIAEQTKAVEYQRENDKTETQKILDAVVDASKAKPVEDQRSDTQKALDALTEKLVARPKDDERSETQKALDTLTEKQTRVIIEGNNKTLEIKDDANVVEEVKKPKRPGRPRKNQQ